MEIGECRYPVFNRVPAKLEVRIFTKVSSGACSTYYITSYYQKRNGYYCFVRKDDKRELWKARIDKGYKEDDIVVAVMTPEGYDIIFKGEFEQRKRENYYKVQEDNDLCDKNYEPIPIIERELEKGEWEWCKNDD